MEQLSLGDFTEKQRSSLKTGTLSGVPVPSSHITGSVEKVASFNDETGQCVLEVKTGPERGAPRVLVAGKVAQVFAGQEVEIDYVPLPEGVIGPVYAESIEFKEPGSPRLLKKFLKSGALAGIGPNLATLLSQNFAGKFFFILDHDPARLLTIDGIGRKRQNQLLAAWKEFESRARLAEFLFENQLPLHWGRTLYPAHAEQSADFLRRFPYRAVTRHELAFELMDLFALRNGFAFDSTERLRCGFLDLLREHYRQGHCAFPEDQVLQQASEKLGVPRALIESILELELVEEGVIAETVDGVACLYLKQIWDLERHVAKELLRFEGKEPPWGWFNLEKSLAWAQSLLSIKLAPSQKDAIEKALSSSLAVITGGPGTGKTTLIRSLVTILQTQFAHFALCSPTGRASQRLSEATGVPAQTIHRLLKYNGLTGTFTFNHENPLKYDLVLIDEASMVDLSLMASLLEALPAHCALILVGDADQIPSVGAGSILQSIIASGRFSVVTLKDIFRQSEHSLIKLNAQRINQGLMPLTGGSSGSKDFHFVPVNDGADAQKVVQDLFTRVLPEKYGIHDPAQMQILVPLNRGALGTQQMNETLQTYIESRKLFQNRTGPSVRRPESSGWGLGETAQSFKEGDKVMVVKNDYQKDVFNGDIGFIRKINHSFQTVEIDFDDRVVPFGFDELDRLTLAYAISIHKSQGSEYRAVIVVLTQEHLPMAQRHLIYTAVTRGKEHVFLVAHPTALLRAIQTDDRRWQKLTELLKAG